MDETKMNDVSYKCNDIYISSNLLSSFIIKSPESSLENFNYSLSKNKDFCIWFTFPFYSLVNSKVNLPHSQILIADNTIISTHTAEINSKGYNLLYKFLNNSKANNHETAIFKYVQSSSDNLASFVSYEKVNGLYHIDSLNIILVPLLYYKNFS